MLLVQIVAVHYVQIVTYKFLRHRNIMNIQTGQMASESNLKMILNSNEAGTSKVIRKDGAVFATVYCCPPGSFPH
jgi:hypothetical protein